MKKYIVLKKIGIFGYEEDRQFNNLEDAQAYQKLCKSAEDNPRVSYIVAEVLS